MYILLANKFFRENRELFFVNSHPHTDIHTPNVRSVRTYILKRVHSPLAKLIGISLNKSSQSKLMMKSSSVIKQIFRHLTLG